MGKVGSGEGRRKKRERGEREGEDDVWESFSPPLFPPRVCALPPALPNRYYKEERAIFGALRPVADRGESPPPLFQHAYLCHARGFFL